MAGRVHAARRRLVNAVKSSRTVFYSALIAVVGAGCSSDGTGPNTLRFGQVGELRIRIQTPLQAGLGELQQALTWRSDGAWTLFEEIGYLGSVGETNLEQNPGVPAQFASSYATLITQLNEVTALSLFDPELDPSLDPECGVGASRVLVTIRDRHG